MGREISSDRFLTNILCRNCADKNETLVRKLHGVRESLESSRKAITEEKGGITSVKRQARDSDRGTSEQKSNKRALFVAQFRIARDLKSIFHRFRDRPHVGIWTARHVSMRLVLVGDSFIPKGPWEVIWLVQAHRPVFGLVKLAPIKYETSLVSCHMKYDEGLFWKSV